jgi:tRNA pseudouridine32 synthase/23S rRNA pseudouridine746 synthase
MSDNPKRFELHLTLEEDTAVAVDFIAAHCDLSKARIKVIMQRGAVWLTQGKKTQRLRRAKRELKVGQTVHVYYDEHVIDAVPIAPTLVADMQSYSVWNKPCGMLSQGSKWGDHCTVTRWAEQHLKPERPAFVVHRLDRAANGLILVAHSKQAAAKLSALFQTRNIEKRYRIQVAGLFVKTEAPIRVEQDVDGKHAVSHFMCLSHNESEQSSEIDVSIETGRKHQIRRHAQSLSFPVIGDRLYGDVRQRQDLQLCAYFLAFNCPFSNKKQTFNLLGVD